MTTDQIAELVAIDRASKTGIRTEVQELIGRLTSGGVSPESDDPRLVQAKRLWDKGWGRELNISSFEAYLEMIPVEIPPRPSVEHLDRLILVDRRLKLVPACRLAGLKYDGNDQTFVPFDPAKAKDDGSVYWMWCQDGRRNHGKNATKCRQEFVTGEVGLDAFEFVALYTQGQTVIGAPKDYHYPDLPGSVHVTDRDGIACCDHWDGELWLYRHRLNHISSRFGSASRWEC